MAVTAPVSPSSGTNDLPAFPGVSRRARTTERFSTSRGPISMRSGTPRISQSLNLKPGVTPSRSSSLTRTPPATSCVFTRPAASSTAPRSASVR